MRQTRWWKDPTWWRDWKGWAGAAMETAAWIVILVILSWVASVDATVVDNGDGTATFSTVGPNFRVIDFCASFGWFEQTCEQRDIDDGVCAAGAAIGSPWPTTTCSPSLVTQNVCKAEWLLANGADVDWTIPAPVRCARLLDREVKGWAMARARSGRESLLQKNTAQPDDDPASFTDP